MDAGLTLPRARSIINSMSGSQRLPRGSGLGVPLKVVLAVYVFAVTLLPLSHHDIACHIKSSTHCTTCVAASSAEPAPGVAGLPRITLHATGRPFTGEPARVDSRPLTSASGRAPPAIA
jgi:hypothetical protein